MKKSKKATGNRLEKAVDLIVTRLEKAESFALEQAPDVCKEVIREKVVLGYYNAATSALTSAGLVKLLFFLASFADSESRAEWPYVTSTLAGIAALVFAVIALCNVSELISTKTAPKLTILRELKKLVTKEEESK